MKKTIVLTAILLLSLVEVSPAQAILKMVGKKVEGPITLKSGEEIHVGDQLELFEGRGDEKFLYIMTSIAGAPANLGYGWNYETIEITEIRYNEKQDDYILFSKLGGKLYMIDVEKGLKSGEIKQIIPKSN